MPSQKARTGDPCNDEKGGLGRTVSESVSDNGVGLPEGFDFRGTSTVGFDLITILAEQQLRGELQVKANGGTTIAIRFKELEYKKRY